MSEALSLANIRSSLIRQEDTIIFGLIERAQFALNAPVYTPDAIPVPAFCPQTGRRYSLLEYALRDMEQTMGRLRRYTSPDEHAFYPEDLPALVLPPMTFQPVLASYSPTININSRILSVYVEHVLPDITVSGDDNNYGSSCMLDVTLLQALSKRIHYGMFVAEAKFREKPAEYTELIKARNEQGIMDLLTDVAVEERVIQRVMLKATTFGQDIVLSTDPATQNDTKLKISPKAVGDLYRDWVMPLTKDVELEYLLRRLSVEK